LRAGGYKHRGLKTQHFGDLRLQRVDARVVTKHVIAQRSSVHGRAHRGSGLGHGVAAQIDGVNTRFFNHFGLWSRCLLPVQLLNK